MATIGPKSPTANDSGWDSGNNGAHADGGAYASTATPDDIVIYEGYDFALLPSDATVLGITVRLDHWKDTTGGDGTLTLTVSLSWNAGTSWTSTKVSTALDDSIEVTSNLGGAADTWGRTWTVSELQTSNFRARVKATGTVDFDNPTWVLDWIPITVTYSRPAIEHTIIEERVQLADSSGGSGLSGGESLTGGTIDELAGGGPTFEAASESFAKMETISVQILLGGTTFRVWYVSDAIAAQRPGGGSIGAYQPGVLEWGDLVMEGIFGLEHETTGIVFRIRNTTLANQLSGAVDEVSTSMQTGYLIGWTVYVSAWVEDGGIWYSRLLFSGKIEEVLLREDYVELRAFQVTNEEVLIPKQIVDEKTFNWGDAEGKRPEGVMGSAIPIFYGRFGPTALKEYASGPFNWDQSKEEYTGEAQPTAMFRRFVFGIYYSMMMGIRTPLVAPVLGADMNRGVIEEFPSSLSKVRQAMFLLGDRIAPQITMTEKLSADYRYLGEPHANFESAEFFQHGLAGTWDAERSRVNLFCRDVSSDMPQTWTYAAQGFGDGLRIRPGGISLTGGASSVNGFFINRGTPDWGTTEAQKWSGLLQMCALSFTKLSQIRRTTASLAYGTTAGVVNPTRAFDPNPDTYAEVPVGEVLSLQGPEIAPNLGEIVSVRVGILPHGGGAATSYSVAARWSWEHSMTLTAAQGWTDPTNGAPLIYTIKPRYTPIKQDPISGTPGTTGWADEWRFVHYSKNPDNANLIEPYPMDLRIVGSGGTLRVAHVWLEVIYRPDRVDEPVKQIEFAEGRIRQIPREEQRGPFGGVQGYWEKFLVTPLSKERSLGRPSPVLLGGTGPRDTVDSRYTNAVEAIIENPVDIVGHMIEKYMGTTPFTDRAQGTAFGSFIRARDRLNAIVPGTGAYSGWKMAMTIGDRQTVRRLFARIGSQCCTLFQEQLPEGSPSLIWRAFVDEPDPATTAPERMYRTDGYLFRWDHIVPDSFEVRLTDRSTLADDFLLRYGGEEGIYEKFCRPTSNNFATNGTAYQTACAAVETQFLAKRQIVLEAPDIWNHATAEALLKWHMDSRRTRRVLVEFDTFGQCVDLKPGHVIKFSDEIGQRIGYPGLRSGANWNTHQFNVLNVRISKDAGRPITVHVVAIECYERAA